MRRCILLLLMLFCAVPVRANAPDTLRVLIYNVRHGEGMDHVLDLERTAAVIRSQRPDVVALQEIDSVTVRTNGVDQAAELARLTGMPHYAFGRFMAYDGGAYGMALLSAWPLREVENHVLPPGTEPRSTLAARLQPGAGMPEIVVAGIHLYNTPEERYAQAQQLVELFEGETSPVFLAGDFNSQPGGRVMRYLGGHWHVPPKDGAPLTWDAAEPSVEIDFILFRPEGRFEVIEHRVIEEAEASDHRPVLLVLRAVE